MGQTLSRSDNSGERAHDRDDDHYARPSKRRRCAGDSPDSGIVQDILHEEPGELQRALRIEVLKIIHKDSSRVRSNGIFNGNTAPAVNSVLDTRTRCRITISSRQPGEARVLHSDSQICTIKTFKNPIGPSQMARVYLPQPFNVPEDKIFIERDDDAVFDLADAYTLAIDIESAGDPNWPPLNLAASIRDKDIFTRRSPRLWVLKAEIPQIFGRSRATALRVRKGLLQDSYTDYVMDVDVRWTTGLPEKAMAKKLEKDVLPSITVFDHREDPMALVNGNGNGNGIANGTHVNGALTNGAHANSHLTNGHVNGVEDDLDEEAEGELTPSRSLRAREAKNYNLKVLSAQAQGKEPRKRRHGDWKKLKESNVFYILPKEAVPVREVVVEGFACCICHAVNHSAVQLRAHLMSHSHYNFVFDSNQGKSGCEVTVSQKPGSPGSLIRSKIYQLGKPTKPLDLDKYVDGDESWVTSRLGPQNYSSQRTAGPRSQQKALARRKEKKVVVPSIKQPLFDPLSKTELVPGTEVPPYTADDTWLLQKHRDTIDDFFDIDPSEKEYMKVWDSFVLKERLTSDAYLPRAFLAFVKDKAQWLVASESRCQEFGKHLAVLTARGSIDDRTIQEAVARIQEVRPQKTTPSEKDKPSQSPKEARYRSSKGCAVCGRSVRGPQLLVCDNEDCMKPLFHKDCAKSRAKMPLGDPHWRCNDCFKP